MSSLSKINISIVIPSLEIGGAESMVYQLAKAVDKKVFNLHLICLYSKSESFFEKELSNSDISITFLNKGLGFNIFTIVKLWKKLNEFNTHVVHTHLGACLYAFPWSLFHNKKLLHTVHNIPLKELPYIHRRILKTMYKSGKAVPIAISDTIRTQLSSFYKLKKEHVQVVYNPVNINRYSKKNINHRNKMVTYVCVARMVYQKNHKMLLKAFSILNNKVPNTKLILAGDGELKEELKKEATNLKISEKVIFLGNVKNIPKLLQQADVFVLTSFYEGLPMTILEAMGSKLPVIVTRVGGVSDIVKDNGILVESNDYNGFSSAMVQLSEDKELREKMGHIGYEMSKKYDIALIVKQYENLYRTYIKS